MSLQYYRKELASNLILVAGKPVPFEQLDGNRGCIAVDDVVNPALVSALDQLAAKRRGGVSKITEGEYSHIKAAHPFSPSVKRSHKETLRALPPSIRPAARPSARQQSAAFNPVAALAAAAAGVRLALASAPKPTAEAQVAVESKPPQRFQPPTRRISRKEALGEGV